MKSIQELFKELATIIKPEKPDGPGKCIKHLTIHAHGMFDLKDKMGGFKIGEEQVTAYKGSTSAEQFGILLEDALCADATINLWVCWGANHDFLASLGRLANATVRGTSGLFQVEYDDDPTKEKTKPIMWIVPDGIDEFKPPKNFPDDKERDLEGLGKKDWGETKPATGIGEQQKDSRYVSGKTLWD